MSHPENQLTGLIKDISQSSLIGPERKKGCKNNVALFFQSKAVFNSKTSEPYGGSYRFVKYVNDQIVAGMQVMSENGKSGIITNIYCLPEYRRQSHMTDIYNVVIKKFKDVKISDERSADGTLWVQSLNNNS